MRAEWEPDELIDAWTLTGGGSGSTAAVFRSSARRARASSSTSAAMRSMTARTRARSTTVPAVSGQSAAGRRLTTGG